MKKGFATVLIIIFVISLAVFGTIAYLRFKPKPVVKITPSTTPTPTPDPTAGWKTYTNTAYLYSFKYPQSWRILAPSVAGDVLITSRPTTKKASGDFSPGVGGISITPNTKATVIQNTPGVEKTSKVAINGISATEIQGHSGVAGTVYFDSIVFGHNGNTYEITLSTQDSDFIQPLTIEFHQILSTFRFDSP